MTTFPTPPLLKIVKAWTYLIRTPGSRDKATWLETTGGRLAEDRHTKSSVQTVNAAQTILTAHSDTT